MKNTNGLAYDALTIINTLAEEVTENSVYETLYHAVSHIARTEMGLTKTEYFNLPEFARIAFHNVGIERYVRDFSN